MLAVKRVLVTSVLLFLSVTPLTLGAALVPGAAHADDPAPVTNTVTDDTGALGSKEESSVRAAVDEFYAETGLQLYVVYVPSFGSLTGPEWAAATAKASGLGSADLLVALATDTGAHGYATQNRTFSTETLRTIDSETVDPAMRRGDYAAAAIETARAYTDAVQDSGPPWGRILLIALLVAALAAWGVRRMRTRFDHTHHVLDEHGKPVDPAAILTPEELDAAAGNALVALDDALRTSEQELWFAEAQHGQQATEGFRQVLRQGHDTLRDAFRLRQELDAPSGAGDVKTRNRAASRILALCESVDHALDGQAEAFDRLRDLPGHIAEVLDELEERRSVVSDRLAAGQDTLGRVRSDHPAAATTSVTDNADQADLLVDTAGEQIVRGRDDLRRGDQAAAVAHARAAEDGLAQAGTLLDALDALDARDHATTGADDLDRAAAAVTAVDAFVDTRRGAIGPAARTRLSEADRHLELAKGHRSADPDRSATLVRVEELAHEAQSHAEADVAAWRGRQEQRDDRRPPGAEAMVLGGILVDAVDRGPLGGVLGGSTHGGGSGKRYSGSSRPRRPGPRHHRTTGSFGGTATRNRRGRSDP